MVEDDPASYLFSRNFLGGSLVKDRPEPEHRVWWLSRGRFVQFWPAKTKGGLYWLIFPSCIILYIYIYTCCQIFFRSFYGKCFFWVYIPLLFWDGALNIWICWWWLCIPEGFWSNDTSCMWVPVGHPSRWGRPFFCRKLSMAKWPGKPIFPILPPPCLEFEKL